MALPSGHTLLKDQGPVFYRRLIHPQSRFFRNTLLPYKQRAQARYLLAGPFIIFRLPSEDYCWGVVVCGVVEGEVGVDGEVVEDGLVLLPLEPEPYEPLPVPVVEEPEPVVEEPEPYEPLPVPLVEEPEP